MDGQNPRRMVEAPRGWPEPHEDRRIPWAWAKLTRNIETQESFQNPGWNWVPKPMRDENVLAREVKAKCEGRKGNSGTGCEAWAGVARGGEGRGGERPVWVQGIGPEGGG
jgi:hypothetical protein